MQKLAVNWLSLCKVVCLGHAGCLFVCHPAPQPEGIHFFFVILRNFFSACNTLNQDMQLLQDLFIFNLEATTF